MTKMREPLRWMAIASAAILVSRIALGDAAEDEARVLFKQGVTLLQKGSFEEALARFNKAYELWHNPKILLNIATTLRELGRLPQAADAYEAYEKDSGADPARREEVRTALREIDATVVRLVIEVSTADATVKLDGVAVERPRGTPTDRIVRTLPGEVVDPNVWRVRLMPGEHVVEVSSAGMPTRTEKFVGSAGEQKTLRIVLEKAAAKPTATTAPTAAPDAEEPAKSLSHASQVVLLARADIDGKFRGAVGVLGIGYGLGDVVELHLAALVGRDKGFEAGASFYFSTGMFKPVAYVGVPTFFADGASPGGHLSLGLQLDPSRNFGILAQVGVAQFLRVPEDRESTAFVPSLGAQGRF